jgi:hypothetical protein
LHAFCDFCLLSAGLTLSLSVIVAVGCFTGGKPRTTTGKAPLLES